MSTIIPYRDIEEMAKSVVASRLFGMKSPSEAIALMLVAQAEGLHPMVAARDYDIIQGRPALKSRAMLARFQQSGGKIDWKTRSDTECEAAFSHPQSPTPVTIRWDWKRATQAGLTGKDNWRKYPAQMLAARVISEGVNACYPAACNGMYTPEEVADFDDKREVVKEATVVETWRDGPADIKAMGAGFDRVPPPAEPAAAELDEKINGKREEPPAEAREIIVKFQGKGKPPVKKFPQEMTGEELDTAIETARWRWKQAHDKADKYSEKNMNEAKADGLALQAELARRKQAGVAGAAGVVPAGQSSVDGGLVAPDDVDAKTSVVTPAGDSGAGAATAPDDGPPASEAVPAPIEADVLTAKTRVTYKILGKRKMQGTVGELSDDHLQDALDLAKLNIKDGVEVPHNMGVVNLVYAEMEKRGLK